MTDTTIIVHVFTPGEGLSHACTNLPFTDSKNNYKCTECTKSLIFH